MVVIDLGARKIEKQLFPKGLPNRVALPLRHLTVTIQMKHEFPAKHDLTICFAHVAYQLAATFDKRQTGINHFQAWSRDELGERIAEADILVISGFWHNELLDMASRQNYLFKRQ